MKRKRGHKKGKKSKKSKSVTEQEENLNESEVNAEKQTSEQSSEAPPAECENSEDESKMEVDAPPSSSPPIAAAASVVDPVASVSRVKVKLKTSKAPEAVVADTEKKSSPQVEPEKPPVAFVAAAVEKKEEPVPVPPRKPVFLNVYRKTKGIKIKTSKAVVDGSSSSVTEKSGGDVVVEAAKAQDVNVVVEKDTKKTTNEDLEVKKVEPEVAPVSSSSQNEVKKTDQDSRYKKQELDDSLTVIKKIMKMEAADPFNVPVNPEALGIPDYFDIIKTPMDFGTICSNFEKGNIYMNSEDVYKDVQYIWNNCSKYNKKGDYIVDLMRRVKKNFMKYWTAAGLYTEQSAADNAQLEDGGKASTKGSQSKQKSHKRHGRHHKSDCMCAICMLKRRKRERQGSQGHSGAQEESSPVGSPSVDNSSINMGEEQDIDVDVHNKTGQEKTEIVELDSPVAKRQRVSENKQQVEEEEQQQEEVEEVEEVEEEEEEEGKEVEENLEVESENKTEDKTQSVDRVMEETGGDEPVTSSAEKSVVLASVEDPKPIQNEQEEKEKQLQEEKEMQELKRKEWRAKIHDKFQVRNPKKLLNLCETLFPSNDKRESVWNGPHSLFKRRGSSSNRSSSLHKAVEALMK